MSTDLKHQLDGYFSQVDEADTAIDATEVASRLDSVRPVPAFIQPPMRFWRRPVVVAAGAALLVLMLLAIPALLRPSTDDLTPATTPDPTVPPTVVTTVTTTPVLSSTPPPDLAFEEITYAAGAGPQHGYVQAGSSGLMVLQPALEGFDDETGAPTDPDGDPRTILWLSDDGQTWEPHELDQFPGGGRPYPVGEVNGTYVLWGWDDEGQSNYLSTDLETWVRWDLPPVDGQRPGLTVGNLTAMGDAVLGTYGPSFVRAESDFSDAQVIEDPFGTENDLDIWDVVATANRFYALVYDNASGRSEVWSSSDGIEWIPEIVDLPPNSEAISSVIAANDHRVLVFIHRTGRAGPFWIAESGEPFEGVGNPSRLAVAGLATAAEGELRVAATDDGFVVSFTTGFGSGDAISESGPYTTTDGSEWAQAMPAGTSVGTWATSGSTIFAATGQWVVELNEDGDVASEFFKQDGAWIIGTTSN